MTNTDVDLLSEYFKVKAISVFIFYLLGMRFSDIFYALRVKLDSHYDVLKSVYLRVYFIVGTIISLVAVAFYFSNFNQFSPLILALYVFIMDDSTESAVSLCRLFEDYRTLVLIRLLYKLSIPF